MEYASDLKEFWKRGYGYDINSKASCVLFHDLFDRLNKATSERRSVKLLSGQIPVKKKQPQNQLLLNFGTPNPLGGNWAINCTNDPRWDLNSQPLVEEASALFFRPLGLQRALALQCYSEIGTMSCLHGSCRAPADM